MQWLIYKSILPRDDPARAIAVYRPWLNTHNDIEIGTSNPRHSMR